MGRRRGSRTGHYRWVRLLGVVLVVATTLAALTIFASPATAVQHHPPNATPSPDSDFHLVARYQTEAGYVNETVLEAEDLANVTGVREDVQRGLHFVGIRLTKSGARQFASRLVESGFEPGACTWETSKNDSGNCLLAVVEGDVVYAAGMNPELYRSMEAGVFVENPVFVFQAQNRSRARALRGQILGRSGGSSPTGSPTSSPEGPVRILAYHPTDGGYENETVLTPGDVSEVSDAAPTAGSGFTVGVRLHREAGRRFADRLEALGFDGTRECHWRTNRTGYCLLVVQDGEVLSASGVGGQLARKLRRGRFREDPTFVIASDDPEAAERIARGLRYTPTTTPDKGLPGFTLAVTLVALAGGLLVARRRKF